MTNTNVRNTKSRQIRLDYCSKMAIVCDQLKFSALISYSNETLCEFAFIVAEKQNKTRL